VGVSHAVARSIDALVRSIAIRTGWGELPPSQLYRLLDQDGVERA